MPVDWETFKYNLGCLLNTSIVYVDEEGSEIPIDCDMEFQEALRLAKLNNSGLKLIFYDGNNKRNATTSIKCKSGVNTSEKLQNDAKKSSVLYNSNLKENTCHCKGDVPPEWFIHYMKKFKKDLLDELKTNVFDTVENAVEKTKKLSNKKPDFMKELISFKKNLPTSATAYNQSSSSTTTPNKKKKKILEKDLAVDLRAIKATKRLERIGDWRAEKFEKVEKSDSRTRLSFEEKKRKETKSFFKTRPETMDGVIRGVENKRKPYNSRERGIFLFLTPGGEFTINLEIINDGKGYWFASQVKCFELMGLQVYTPCIELPDRLHPYERCTATIRGRAGRTVGLQHFEFVVLDNGKKIGSQFTCWARVDFFEPHEVYSKVSVHCNVSNSVRLRVQESDASSIDFETDLLIANTEKKIEENIMEIEKRLRGIDLLRPSTTEEIEETFLKNNGDKPKKVNTEKILSCDSIQDSKEKDKNWKERLDQEEILLGVDCLRLTTESDESFNKHSEKDGNKKSNKDPESETSSDSELSVICTSEDETFIVVPLPSKRASPPTLSESEDKRPLKKESVIKPTASDEQLESNGAKEELSKPDSKNEVFEQPNKNVNQKEDVHSGQLSPIRTRRSPFGEEISEFKPKKMKSKSTEYCFTTANLSQPTFTPIPEGLFGVRPSKFTFTGEEKEKPQAEGRFNGGPSKFTFTAEKEEKSKKENFTERNIPKADALGRVIYAVTINGYCLPVGDLLKNGERCRGPKEDNRRKEEGKSKIGCEKKTERFNEVPTVNILPNLIMNGASNVASLAFSTAKSVINNLQSAFVTEGKTELGKPACEDKKKLSMEAMYRLYEMGFSDLHLNQELLLNNDNNLLEVVEELIRRKENPSEQPH